MKVGDYNKFKEYFESNPEAQEAPDSILEEKPAETQITIEDLMKELNSIKEALAAKKESTPEPVNDAKSEIESLKATVKDLTAEMQKANQANTELPKEETADDILEKFLTGGI